MCKHNLRTMMKPSVVVGIGAFEMGYWCIICGWIIAWYYKLDEKAIQTKHISNIGYGHEEQRVEADKAIKEELRDWKDSLWTHSILSFLFVPIATLLFLGVRRKSRFIILSWILLSTSVAFLRIWALAKYSNAYIWLRWLEIYWIARVYFLLVTCHYVLDLWGEAAASEQLDPPMLIPEDNRKFRGVLGYPAVPMTRDDRPRVIGTGRHIPMHLDWMYVVNPTPTWFDSSNEAGHHFGCGSSCL